MIKGVSLFSSAGIGEYYFKDAGVDIVIANEIVQKRAMLYKYFYPNSKMITGDITKIDVFDEIIKSIETEKPNFLVATPPCQGMSTLGKKDYDNDKRNYLIFYVLDIIDLFDFDYILIENVPKFIKLFFPYNNEFLTLEELLKSKYDEIYNVEVTVLNAADFGVPQSRPRSIVRMYKKDKTWSLPKSEPQISLRESIGELPSLEAGERSDLKWHFAKFHNEREILAMKHTQEGKSAMINEHYYPKKADGTRIKGFHNTYKRMKWDFPSPARAINSGNMGGHNNVHPGRPNNDGTVSDARVLTLRELFIVSSLPEEIDLPEWASDTLIRTVIGESVPPLFSKKIVEKINE